jgi:hypothetical protein
MRTVEAVMVRGRWGDGDRSGIGEAGGELSDGKAGDETSGDTALRPCPEEEEEAISRTSSDVDACQAV